MRERGEEGRERERENVSKRKEKLKALLHNGVYFKHILTK